VTLGLTAGRKMNPQQARKTACEALEQLPWDTAFFSDFAESLLGRNM